ncbi:MAG: Uma2 family endonuclease [Planctomycetes bacterium]|nr:Uma2 family endonuclease [Planctomycetota bacterium]
MTLAEFEGAEGQPGHLYELSRGVVSVVDVPNRRHLALINALKRQVHAYDLAHPGRLHTIATGRECKILLPDLESERHPDLAIYLTPPPEGEDFWARWIPALVMEVVSPGSEERDYVAKREEYLRFGVSEYWIVDADKQEMLVLRRRSRKRWQEQVVRPPEIYQTRWLPGLEFSIALVFQAGEAAGNR